VNQPYSLRLGVDQNETTACAGEYLSVRQVIIFKGRAFRELECGVDMAKLEDRQRPFGANDPKQNMLGNCDNIRSLVVDSLHRVGVGGIEGCGQSLEGGSDSFPVNLFRKRVKVKLC
jgi:hypothetical protein